MRTHRRVSRRGQVVASSVDWVVGLIVTFFIVFMLVFLVNSFRNKDVDTVDIDKFIYLAKLHYSPEILYEVDDATGIPRRGVIDLDKFSSAKIDENNHYESDPKLKKYIGAEITLLSEDFRVVRITDLENPIYNNKEVFTDYEGFARMGVEKAGGATYFGFLLPVAYRQNGELKKGLLNITTVRPNS